MAIRVVTVGSALDLALHRGCVGEENIDDA
jgi:hypothetical protein